MNIQDAQTRRSTVGSWVLYGLAALLLIASIFLGLSIVSTAAAIPAATVAFQSPILIPVWEGLVSGLRFLGGLVLAGGIVMAIIVFCLGFILRYVASLSQRIAALEGEQPVHMQASPEGTV